MTFSSSIQPTDTIMARATFRGRIIAQFISTGFASLSDVLRAVRAAAGSIVGFIDISLRNASRGWTENQALFIRPVVPGTQLTLF